ncbi:MAG: PHP domain-containing protein [Clostridiales bacterium]|nr:PHP domain-containing protein [Clostridiales bacterium]
MRADLHVHSIYSDGFCAPDELCRLAKIRGVELLSITDHDTMNGEETKRAAAKKHGVNYLSGWEISAYQEGEQVHILGYGCAQNAAYLTFMEKRMEMAWLRAKERVEKLHLLGVPVTMEQVLTFRKDPTAPIHTMHVARAAAAILGLHDSEVYKEYLARGKAAYSDIGRPTPFEAIDCIHASGGIAVMAHPGRIWISAEEKETLIKSLAEYGLDGIEAFYTTHTEKETAWFKDLAERYHLLITGGSDTHIEDKTHTIGSPAFYADEKLLQKLHSLIV